MARQPTTIDKAKLRATVCKLGHECTFYMLDDAIELLSPAKLHQIAGGIRGTDHHTPPEPLRMGKC